MKKTLLIALMGLMFVAFASCHSKQYKDLSKVLDQVEDIMNNAKTCTDLQAADNIEGLAVLGNNYDQSDMMSESEAKKITERSIELWGKLEQKASELCGDAFGGGYDDYGYDYDDYDFDDYDYDDYDYDF